MNHQDRVRRNYMTVKADVQPYPPTQEYRILGAVSYEQIDAVARSKYAITQLVNLTVSGLAERALAAFSGRVHR